MVMNALSNYYAKNFDSQMIAVFFLSKRHVLVEILSNSVTQRLVNITELFMTLINLTVRQI